MTLSEIAQLLKDTSPGKWWKGSWHGQCHEKHLHGKGDCRYQYYKNTETECVSTESENVELIGHDEYGAILSKYDAAFIAKSKEIVTHLVSEVKRLEREKAAYRKICQMRWWGEGNHLEQIDAEAQRLMEELK